MPAPCTTNMVGARGAFRLTCPQPPKNVRVRARLLIRCVSRFWWGKQRVASQPASYSDRRGKTVYPVFNRLIFLGVRRSKQDAAQEVVLQPPSTGTTKMPPACHACNNKSSYK